MFNNLLDLLNGTNPDDTLGGGVPTVPVMNPGATPGVSQMQQNPQGLLSTPQGAPTPDLGSPSFMSMLRYAPGMLASRFGQGVQDAVAPVPPGMSGLFAPQDIQGAQHRGLLDFGLSMLGNARSQHYGEPAPSLGQALQQGVSAGREGVQGQLTGNLQNQMMAMQLAQQLRILRSRQALGPAMQPQPGENQSDWMNRARQAYMNAIGNSDFQTADALKDVVTKPELDPEMFRLAHPDDLQQFDLGDHIVLRSGRTGQSIVVPKTAAPISPLDIKKFNQTQLQDETTRTSDLQGKFQDETKDIREAGNGLRNISAVQTAARGGDPAAQIAVLDNFLRLNNPGGMARPNQIQMAAEARGLIDKVRNFAQNAKTGSKLSAAQVDRFVHAANEVGGAWRQKYAPIESRYRQWAQQAQVNPSTVVNDPFAGVNLGGGSPNGAGAAPTPASASEAPPSAANVRRYVKPPAAAAIAPATKLVAKPQAPPLKPKPKKVSAAPMAPPSPGLMSEFSNWLFAPKAFPTASND